MCAGALSSHSDVENSWQLMKLADAALAAQSLQELFEFALPVAAGMAEVSKAFLFVSDPSLPDPQFVHRGLLKLVG